MSLLAAIFLAFWYVTWPFTPNFVMKYSPWILPMVRAISGYRHFSIADEVAWIIGQNRIAEMAKTRTDEMETVLVDCLQRGNSDLRITALGLVWHVAERRQIGDALCMEVSRAFNVRTEPEVSDAASRVVLFLPRAEAEQMLTEMFDSEDDNLQAIAIYGMSELGNKQLVERVRLWLSDPQLTVQRNAIFLLTVAKDRASIPMVRPFIHHQDPDVAIDAMRFLQAVDAPVEE